MDLSTVETDGDEKMEDKVMIRKTASVKMIRTLQLFPSVFFNTCHLCTGWRIENDAASEAQNRRDACGRGGCVGMAMACVRKFAFRLCTTAPAGRSGS